MPVADFSRAPLDTPGQRESERLALRLNASPAMQAQKRITMARLAADDAARTASGMHTLQSAVDQMAFAVALSIANSNPERPEAVWIHNESHAWFGHAVPGSCWGGGHPGDAVYRYVRVNSEAGYEIIATCQRPGPVQFSFHLYDTHMGEGTRQSGLMDEPLGGLRDVDIVWDNDDSFTVTLDREPANGRPNHIRMPTDARVLLIRDMIGDWKRQNPLYLDVIKVSGTEAQWVSDETELERSAVAMLKAAVDPLLRLKNGALAVREFNALTRPVLRGGNWGFVVHGDFHLQDDEALMVTLDPLGAKYLGIGLTDPWLAALEHVRANGCLNNAQTSPSRDGSFTFVIAATDPGIGNWIETGGLQDGKMIVRWQALPASLRSADAAVQGTRLVKMRELPDVLPAGTATLRPGERERLRAERALDYARRYLRGDAADANK